MQVDYSYLAEVPDGLLSSCDILLKLDDGGELPAHSQILARYSTVFTDMLATGGGPLSWQRKVDVPLENCTREAAVDFLTVVYSPYPSKHINEASALPVARLADKYGMKVCLCYACECLGGELTFSTYSLPNPKTF